LTLLFFSNKPATVDTSGFHPPFPFLFFSLPFDALRVRHLSAFSRRQLRQRRPPALAPPPPPPYPLSLSANRLTVLTPPFLPRKRLQATPPSFFFSFFSTTNDIITRDPSFFLFVYAGQQTTFFFLSLFSFSRHVHIHGFYFLSGGSLDSDDNLLRSQFLPPPLPPFPPLLFEKKCIGWKL